MNTETIADAAEDIAGHLNERSRAYSLRQRISPVLVTGFIEWPPQEWKRFHGELTVNVYNDGR